MRDKLPELLAPAGSTESLRAALAAGADAVYFGGRAFSNRMRAKNFDSAAIRDAIKLCHSAGAKAYITVNTRVRDREMPELLRFAEEILPTGEDSCDAIIVADLGAAIEIKRHFPHVTLHASTQTSMASAADCKALADLGFTRLVVPRELSLREIRALSESTPMELEMFIHGAHCVSLSGQCLLSAVMGGRSGNRGECAQPCRLPYSKNGREEYPLSLADMCLAGRMCDVIASGAASLKIEGRLKPAGYVYGVTKIYRTLLDERRDATRAEIDELASLFTRGFTDGYFTEKYGNMRGRKNSGSAEVSQSDISAALDSRLKKAAADRERPISATLTLKTNEKSRLTLECMGTSVTETGEIPSAATGTPITKESAMRYVAKLGGTGFTLAEADMEADIADGLWMSAAALNDLRRRTAAALAEAVEKAKKGKPDSAPMRINITSTVERCRKPAKICVLSTADAARNIDHDSFDRVYAEAWDYAAVRDMLSGSETELCAVLPALCPADGKLRRALEALYGTGCRRVMCHTAGQVYASRELGFVCDMSFRANVTNSVAYRYYKAIGCEVAVLSPEVPSGAHRSIGGGAIIYGRLPLMHLSRCLGLEKSNCAKKCALGRNRGAEIIVDSPALCRGELVDRKNARFPVIGLPDCVNVIYNSVITDRCSKLDEYEGAEALVWYL